MGGLGNQLFQYATGRRLAHKLNTELKLDLTFYERDNLHPYLLNCFNIQESIASPEEIARVKQLSASRGIEQENLAFMPEVLNYPDNTWLYGYWQHEEYFADIADILRQEFTLNKSLSSSAQYWKEKIRSVECAVSMHFRHGDFIYSPANQNSPEYFAIPPLDYYYQCINVIKRKYGKLTLFIFSDNLQWAKENLRADVPIEFVEGDDLQDIEEFYLMSLCRHNILSKSTFSWWGAWLNQNPAKNVFMPIACSDGKKIDARSSVTGDENSPLDSDRWIKIPFDVNEQQRGITIRPYFSLLLVVNNDITTLEESLGSILGQDYKFFELIIVDNASTDGSGKICRELVHTYDNVTLIKLHGKVQNGAAWNIALKAAQGYYALFLKGNDRLLMNALTSLYLTNEHIVADLVNSAAMLQEDKQGDITINAENYSLKKMSAFQNITGMVCDELDKMTLLKILADDERIFPLQTRLFKLKFLRENHICFDEKIGDDAENLFVFDVIFRTREIIFTTTVFYVAPNNL